jgi:hypothetical protein
MDYNLTVLKCLSQMKTYHDNQETIRAYIALASSFLMLDAAPQNSPETGITQWALGFERIMDVVAALHASSLLDVETVQAVNGALSESWSNTDTIQGTEFAQEKIKGLAGRLRKLLDNGESTESSTTSLSVLGSGSAQSQSTSGASNAMVEKAATYHGHRIEIDFL